MPEHTGTASIGILLNELDRFVKHRLKPKAYLRYGDDFILLEMNEEKIKNMRTETGAFIFDKLKLHLHSKNDVIIKARHGLKFLGVRLWPYGRRLSKRNKARVASKLNSRNTPSYHGIILQHGGRRMSQWLDWKLHELIKNFL